MPVISFVQSLPIWLLIPMGVLVYIFLAVCTRAVLELILPDATHNTDSEDVGNEVNSWLWPIAWIFMAVFAIGWILYKIYGLMEKLLISEPYPKL